MREFVIISAIFLFPVMPIGGQTALPIIPPGGNKSILVFPCVKAGTHDLFCGLSANAMSFFDIGFAEAGIGAFASGKAYLSSPGLEAKGFQTSVGIEAIIAGGKTLTAPSPWPDQEIRSSLTLRLAMRRYVDSWGTGQALGSMGFAFSREDWSLGFLYYNDFFAFLNRDEYRTAAAEICVGFDAWGKGCMIALGLKLWTGSAIGNLKRGEFYDMSLSPVGGRNSAGIVYGAFRIAFLGVELGWDAEGIRGFFQNGLHWLMDDGAVPLIERPDRLYLALSLFRDGDLY